MSGPGRTLPPLSLDSLPREGGTLSLGRWEAELGGVRLLFGSGRLADLGPAARALGARRALLVTDAGVRAAGHAGAAERSLAAAAVAFEVFAEVPENPSARTVEAGAGFARDRAIDLVVAVGGGSVMDAAKGLNLLLTNGGRIEHYRGYGKATRPLLPAIAVPTTAGTGSDAQSYAVISDPTNGRKMACGDPGARFRSVLLDPEPLRTLPRPVAARAGMDALSHAVESLVSSRRTAQSSALAGEAWGLLASSFEACAGAPPAGADAGALARMLLGAHLAGAAVEASMLGAAHACANPLTARCRIIHGEAVGLMLPAVVRFNASVAGELYERLEAGGAEALAARLEALRRLGGLPERLGDAGVERRMLPELARLAAEEWTGGFNPRPLAERDFLALYEAAF